MLTLVALRLALGCHFLYEGVWKITHYDFLHEDPWKTISHDGAWKAAGHEEFSAEPFLSQAKGPMAGFFYAMLPDLDGRQRLRITTNADGKKAIQSGEIVARWDRIRRNFVDHYRPSSSADAEALASHERLERAAERTYNEFVQKLDAYLADNLTDIEAYFGSLDRFESAKTNTELGQDAPFQKQRNWDRMMKFRQEADRWIKDLEAQERAYANTLYSLLDKQQRQQGLPMTRWNPLQWDRMEQINWAVTFGLTAIGACLMLGFFTPLAALGGAAFMCFVVMTQPAFPTIYPHDSPIVGHALLVNKDFVEMMALLVISATSAGRWGGLDFFIARWWRARKLRKGAVQK